MKIKNLKVLIVLFLTVVIFSSCTKATAKTTGTNNKKEIKKGEQSTPTISRVNAVDFKAATDGKKVQLVDVRTPGEFTQGHIANAVNINVYDREFAAKTAKLDKSKPVYVYCRSGARSMKAAKTLKNNGYNVVNLNQGIIGWSRNGFNFVK